MSTLSAPPRTADIRSTDRPGGANTSHTIAVDALGRLLAAVPSDGALDAYAVAILDANVLGKATAEGRRRSLRQLRQLYLLDPSRVLFRALRDLWDEDAVARPLLAGLVAYARDSVFQASGSAVLPLPPGTLVTPQDLTEVVVERFPDSYNGNTAATIGRNTASSWAQVGHLIGKTRKLRAVVEPRPVNVTLALLLGHLEGVRGQALFTTRWAQFLDQDHHGVERLAEQAAARGYLEMRAAGGVVEIGFRRLLRPFTGEMAG